MSHSVFAKEPVVGSKMTPREMDCWTGLLDGLTSKEIAHRLGISMLTVDHHLHWVLKRLGKPNRLSAVVAFYKGELNAYK